MSTFRVTVAVEDGMLRTSRPLTAPEPIADLIDTVVYQVTETAKIDALSVTLTIETPGESDTWIGDSIASTSREPLPAAADDDDDDEDVPGEVPSLTVPAGQS